VEYIDNDYSKLLNLLYQEYPWLKKEKISLNSNIVEDFNLWGDDCITFLEKLCEYFNVSCNKFDGEKCGDEGFNPLEIIKFIVNIITSKKDKKYGYTIKELLDIIKEKPQPCYY
jgi:hypothetical protein